MADANPNQTFENHAKWFALQIELVRAVGELDKAAAEADLTRAKTLDQLEATRTTSIINGNLHRSLRRIEQAQREFEQQLRIAERRVADLNYIAAGVRPQALARLDSRLDSLCWLFAQSPHLELLFEPLPKNVRHIENWWCMSLLNPKVEAVPAEVDNVIQLADWMRRTLCYFWPGSPAHKLFSKVVVAAAADKQRAVADLQTKLEAVKIGQYGQMAELKKFLNISE
jgi:tetratricopeptide (TPR) repeat protein